MDNLVPSIDGTGSQDILVQELLKRPIDDPAHFMRSLRLLTEIGTSGILDPEAGESEFLRRLEQVRQARRAEA